MVPITYAVVGCNAITSACPATSYTRLMEVDRRNEFLVDTLNDVNGLAVRNLVQAVRILKARRANVMEGVRNVMDGRGVVVTVVVCGLQDLKALPAIVRHAYGSNLSMDDSVVNYAP